jgi:hypothetical protein
MFRTKQNQKQQRAANKQRHEQAGGRAAALRGWQLLWARLLCKSADAFEGRVARVLRHHEQNHL